MIVLIGASGYVGQAYRKILVDRHIPYFGVQRRAMTWLAPLRPNGAEVAFEQNLINLLKVARATFVINAAGYTGRPNVDACEANKRACLEGNVILADQIRHACETVGVPFGHVSSGCIYDGYQKVFTEDDVPNFSFRQGHCSFYSGTKALAEELLAQAKDCYIWRLRVPFNEVDNKRNYLTKLMTYPKLLSTANSLSQLDEFCKATLMCWQHDLPFGTYNIVNSDSIAAEEVVDLIKKYGLESAKSKSYQFFDSLAQFNTTVQTPRSNCVLSSLKIQTLLGKQSPLSNVRDAIITALKNWVPGAPI